MSLLEAVQIGHVKTVKKIIENGADLNITNEKGNTALHIAAWNGLSL